MPNSFDNVYNGPKFYRDDSNTPKKKLEVDPNSKQKEEDIPSTPSINSKVFAPHTVSSMGVNRTIIAMQFPIYLW